MWDVVVVGGGISGLTAAAFAAQAGRRVLLIEGAAHLGGRAHTREQQGFRFNFGPHALYLGGLAMATLEAQGLNPSGAGLMGRGSFFVRNGALVTMPTSLAGMLSSKLMGWRDKFALVKAMKAVSSGFCGEPGDTVAKALDRLTPNQAVRDVFAAQIRVSSYSNAPEIADAAAHFDQLRLAFKGVRYLDGGWGTMVEALAGVAIRAGVEIRLETRAQSISEKAGGWNVRISPDENISTSKVILAVDPANASKLAPGMSVIQNAAASAAPVRAASLDVALSRLPRESHVFALGLDEPTYFSAHSLAAQRLAPVGAALIHVSYYLSPGEKTRPAIRERLEAMLDLMQPGWRKLVVSEQWLPLTYVAYDQPQAKLGGLTGRTQCSIAPGLFVSGDWVGSGGMLSDAAFASGRLAGESAAATNFAGSRRCNGEIATKISVSS